ncbi:MAG: polymer-forming cytoskeletal protein [Gammaproteobacteria bacterium]|jgi:cytoskeletal protein CcmA (bactofilin family)|nr:polymer-forming cytoskeletal protein [Gammaproteobacteria bacterium]MBT3869992.1 polymer-forming cytoskeletal protein [Gammaproteobacteria bacterium]MBT4380931.1 polymer-forming cytoskeletal protein [Gammaproteobacteria bacterium]MBT4618870.1 polymer-forming cytoskeletal protein [Gammaproteobacteria bacterium]MBT5198309.1 polymer-forming cytoskeletal protein [Gammaproteobacteria bacterium]
MFKKEGRSESGTTLVAANCELVGDVHFSDELLVNGIVKGNIYAQSGSKAVVRISEKGRVQGEIRVPRIIVNGEVFGDIWSDKHIELAAKAAVKGNVYYHLIEMVQGARIDGQLVHLQDGKQEVAESKPAKAAEKADEDAAALVTAVKNQTA